MRKFIKALQSRGRALRFKTALILLHSISLLFRPFFSSRKIWILLERGYDAQDNAWHFYNYLKTTHPEIHAYYAIKKASPDYRTNLTHFKDTVVEFGSLWYFILLFNSNFLISSHVQTYAYFTSVYAWFSHSIFNVRAKIVFLQHGCIHNFHPSFEYPKLNVQLFIAGARNEYLLLTSLFKYPISVVKYTGLARFDNLFDYSKTRSVLIMPTWRAKYAAYHKQSFEQTDFFQAYKDVLTDEQLLKILCKYDYELLFYNHFEFQRFNTSFEPLCSSRVKIVKFGETSVQSLLKQASVLVTDYSSVYYDFFYMKKPILFFKLNQDEFQASQYGIDYDSPEDFGYTSYTSKEAIASIISIIENDCPFEERFLSHHSKVFPLYDRNNCQRIFDAISDM